MIELTSVGFGAVVFGALGIGAVIGYIGCVLTEVRGLQQHVYELKKRGFVPHFSVQNEPERDPSEGIREY